LNVLSSCFTGNELRREAVMRQRTQLYIYGLTPLPSENQIPCLASNPYKAIRLALATQGAGQA